MVRKHHVTAVVGGQYGSEGKGVVAAKLADHNEIHIRTGGPNAGHSIIHRGRKWAMQMVPCGWINEHATLILGPGAVINPEILRFEVESIERITGINIRNRLHVDYRATILSTKHVNEEGHTKGELHARIGSTGEGVGAARRDKLLRDISKCAIAEDIESEIPCSVTDTVDLIHSHPKTTILLEGTQGYALSLNLGPWPYVTSHMCTTPQLAADAGIPGVDTVYLVVRTFPIRVAGNSGPLPNEISWDELSERLGREVSEKTTVTKLTRRVAEFDIKMVREAAAVNGATFMVVNFTDYLHPEMEHVTDMSNVPSKVLDWIEMVNDEVGVPIVWVGTGFDKDRGWSHVDMWGGHEY